MNRTLNFASCCAALLAGLALAGCSADAGSSADGAATEPAADQQLTAELQVKFNAYGKALLDRDTTTLDNLLSTEVKNRATEMGSDLGGFADKMKASMLTQFSDMPAASDFGEEFTVTAATLEGDTVRAQLAFRGKALEKPFYFVEEAGEYKLNLLRTGFSKPLPDGAAGARDSYLVTNTNGYLPYPAGTQMVCNGGNVWVPNAGSATVSCVNNCGWWHGTWFRSEYGQALNCDYNTWGTDVWISAASGSGWYCNDSC